MKRVLFMMAATVLAASMGRPVQAQTISLEGYGNWKEASVDLTRTIQRHDRKTYQDCLPLQTLAVSLPGAPESRVVTTHPKCHNGVNMPVWLVSLGEKPRVLVADKGFNLDVTRPSKSLPDVRVQYGDASYCGIRVWRYDNTKSKYVQKQTIRCAA